MDMALTQTRKGNRILDIEYDDKMIVYLVEGIVGLAEEEEEGKPTKGRREDE